MDASYFLLQSEEKRQSVLTGGDNHLENELRYLLTVRVYLSLARALVFNSEPAHLALCTMLHI